MDAISLKDVRFKYSDDQEILAIPELSIGSGEMVFLHGPSGCGKTTLLGVLSGLLNTNSGLVEILGSRFDELSNSARDQFRSKSIGYIFQVFNLVAYLTVAENIALPSVFGRRLSEDQDSLNSEISYLAGHLGILDILNMKVAHLSIGQQQRAAAARALLGSPGLILADEPTSALDADSRQAFLDLLFTQARKSKSTVLFVSHDISLASKFDRSLSLPNINLIRRGAQ